MSKKQQPQGKGNPKNKPQIVDEQNEPFLKALQKKIRNINKKLTEITQLEQKDNLKPEQVQKINRKEALLQERTRFEQQIAFFKTTYAENIEHYRNYQLKELEILARAITVYKAFPQFSEHGKLRRLWQALDLVNGPNLTDAVKNLTGVLNQVANDRKLQKSLQAFAESNKETAIVIEQPSYPQESAGDEPETGNVIHTDEIVIIHEQITNDKGEPEEIEIVERIHDGVVEEISISVVDQTPQEDVSPPPTPAELPKTEGQQVQQQEVKEQRPKTRKYDRPYRGKDNYREKGEYRGERRVEGKRPYNNQNRQKRTYKPKYQEKPQEKVQATNEHSDSESEEEARQFKRNEIEKLQEEGFTVVGKPKPKARDQMNVYAHQHGRKQGHHNLKHH